MADQEKDLVKETDTENDKTAGAAVCEEENQTEDISRADAVSDTGEAVGKTADQDKEGAENEPADEVSQTDAVKKSGSEESGSEESGSQEPDSRESGSDVSDTETPASDESASGRTKESAKAKGGFFKKKDKKDEQIAELNDRVKRQMAEFDNFRKRSEKEKSQMYEIGARSVIEKLLPVIDNFERGLATISEEEKESGFAEGMDKIYRQMTAMLEEAGVTVIEAEGKEFDPNLHNAVMHVEDESLGENVVAGELQKGYMYRDSVVRHSMVKVAN